MIYMPHMADVYYKKKYIDEYILYNDDNIYYMDPRGTSRGIIFQSIFSFRIRYPIIYM